MNKTIELAKSDIKEFIYSARDFLDYSNFDILDNTFEYELFFVRNLIELSLEVINNGCIDCKDCSEKECKEWWIKFNLKKALNNTPK